MKKLTRVFILNLALLATSFLGIEDFRDNNIATFIAKAVNDNAFAQSTSFSTKEVLGDKAQFLEEDVKAGGNFITGTVRVGIAVVLLFGGIVSLAFAPTTGVVFLIVGILVAMYPKIAKGVFNSFGSTKGIFN